MSELAKEVTFVESQTSSWNKHHVICYHLLLNMAIKSRVLAPIQSPASVPLPCCWPTRSPVSPHWVFHTHGQVFPAGSKGSTTLHSLLNSTVQSSNQTKQTCATAQETPLGNKQKRNHYYIYIYIYLYIRKLYTSMLISQMFFFF